MVERKPDLTDRNVNPVPDIVLLGPEWHPRALLRAQLLEEGYEVFAVDTWPAMRRALRPGTKPRLAIVDLHGLLHPRTILNELRVLMNPNRVIVLAASGTLPEREVIKLGYRVLTRPMAVRDIVAEAAAVLGPPPTP